MLESKYVIEDYRPITEKFEQEESLPSSELYQFVGTELDPSVPKLYESPVPRYPQYKGKVTFGEPIYPRGNIVLPQRSTFGIVRPF